MIFKFVDPVTKAKVSVRLGEAEGFEMVVLVELIFEIVVLVPVGLVGKFVCQGWVDSEIHGVEGTWWRSSSESTRISP